MKIVKITAGFISTTLVNPTEAEEKNAFDLIKQHSERHAVEVFRYTL